jgi:hypothetical protein
MDSELTAGSGQSAALRPMFLGRDRVVDARRHRKPPRELTTQGARWWGVQDTWGLFSRPEAATVPRWRVCGGARPLGAGVAGVWPLICLSGHVLPCDNHPITAADLLLREPSRVERTLQRAQMQIVVGGTALTVWATKWLVLCSQIASGAVVGLWRPRCSFSVTASPFGNEVLGVCTGT